MFDVFALPFVQRGILEVLLLSVGAGLVGTWIVLRRLAFFTHAISAATFPGLVLADGIGVAAPLGASGAAMAFGSAVWRGSAGRRLGYDTLTALGLAGAMAVGVILASDVFASGSNVGSLLFGSPFLVGAREIAFAAVVAVVSCMAVALFGRHWTARGFDPDGARVLGIRSSGVDLALPALILLVVVAALNTVGAVTALALVVIPAATVRVRACRMRTLYLGSVALAALEGVLGVWLSALTDAPPGATVAVVAASIFVLSSVARNVRGVPRRLLGLSVLVVLLPLTAGCGVGDRFGGAIDVVATTTQAADLVGVVGGDEVAVHRILRPNVDPHGYEPRPGDVRAIAHADLVVASGGGLDSWIGEMVRESAGRPAVVTLGSEVPIRLSRSATTAGDSQIDPHWWHDPRNVQAAILSIERALAGARPSRSAYFASRAKAYDRSVGALDRAIARCMAKVSPADRKLVTDHDSLRYFADRYGLRVVDTVFPAAVAEAQASAAHVAKIVSTVRRERVPAVFPESSLNPDQARAIAAAAGARLGDALMGDTLGADGSPADTWSGMMVANARAVSRGLSARGAPCALAPIGGAAG